MPGTNDGGRSRPRRPRLRNVVLAGLLLIGGVETTGRPASATPPSVTLVKVASFRQSIVMAVNPANGASYIATRRGLVYMLRPGTSSKLVLDIRSLVRVHGEQGLLGMAFHPTLSYVYLTYNSSTGGDVRLTEFPLNADGTFRRSSRRVVLIQAKPDTNHNGGNIAFGPDGYLYHGFGDGGGGGDPKRNGLKMSTLLGKMIRIDPRPTNGQPYGIPVDNPYVGVVGARAEIWSIGFRNPWRWSFDSATGDLWVGDVGQGKLEEIDLAKSSDGRGRGISFGWSAYEGSDRYNLDQPDDPEQSPLHEYSHDTGGCAVIGGVVYHGAAMPSLQGAYIFSDNCLGKLWAMTLDGDDHPTVTQIGSASAPASFGTDATGEIYVITLGGTVYRLAPAA